MPDSSNKSTIGAWLIHHDQKLLSARTTEFESIATAGRAARILSSISREEEWDVPNDRVIELARVNGIRRHEVAGLLTNLQEQGLVDVGISGVSVLGVSQHRLLDHAADIFESQTPVNIDRAVIQLAEIASHRPTTRQDCGEELSDTFKLSRTELTDIFDVSERIGFIDYEGAGIDRMYFNGSLFKRGMAAKSRAILDGLRADEASALQTLNEELSNRNCLPIELVQQRLGMQLWSKLHQIGFYEVSGVKNERGESLFVVLPSALSKYIPTGLADMLDDAKALASSFTYGIMKSNHARGQIRDPSALINALINRGFVEGPVAAIKQDYQELERRGVVQVTDTPKGYRLDLLKTEIAVMSRDLIIKGDASDVAARTLISSAPTQFVGPEGKRVVERVNAVPETRQNLSRSLDILRKSIR